MRVLTNPTPAILTRIRTFVKKNGRVEPIKLADGRWAVPDSVLEAYPQFKDEIISRTTFVPDTEVELERPALPPFIIEPGPYDPVPPPPPPVRPEGKRK